MDDPHQTDGLSPDDAFEILSNGRRRAVIHYLHEQDGEAHLSDIADHIASWEYGVDRDEINSNQRRRVYISLYQTHLPKLAEYGVVEYDDDEKTVTLTRRVAAVDRFLYIDDREPSRWWLAYVGLATVAAILVAVSWVDGPAFSAVTNEVLALLIAGGFILLSVVHYAAIRVRRGRGRMHRDW